MHSEGHIRSLQTYEITCGVAEDADALTPTAVSCCCGNEVSDLIGKTESSDKCVLEGRGETEDKLWRLILMSAFAEHFCTSVNIVTSTVSLFSSVTKFSKISNYFFCCRLWSL